MVLVAISMVMLLGCVALGVDYSVLLADKNQLQRACDAGALAGASYLQRTGDSATDRANATAEAVRVARTNGLTSSEVTASNVTIYDSDTKLKLTAARNRSLFFIRVMGLYNGLVTANATSAVNVRYTPAVWPVGITPDTYAAYQSDPTARELTLCNLQDHDFIRSSNLSGTYDPFVLTDFRGETDSARHGSPAQMRHQIDGTDTQVVSIGTNAYNLRDTAQTSFFETAMGTVLEKAAGSPWLDPATGIASPNWTTVGDKFDAIFSGTAPDTNPRLVNLFITDPVPEQTGNYAFTVKAFAPVYVESLREDSSGNLILKVRFLPQVSRFNTTPVGLID
jgi:hypothetical protein